MTTPIDAAYWLAPTPNEIYHDLEDVQAEKLRSLCGLRIECDPSEVVLENGAPLFVRRCRSCIESRKGRR